jgi:hydrogenase/urease accessory protein HupE
MRAFVVVIGMLVASEAAAHDLRPGVLSLTERAPGEYALHFAPPIDNRGDITDVSFVLPPSCSRSGDNVRCDGSIAGELAITGMHGSAMKTIVVLVRNGERAEWILDASNSRITIGASPPAATVAWIRLGIAHILAGLDHLAFVISLLLVLDLAINRRLLFTITAFTLAHSITLALAVFGVITVRAAPVEACIALSVLLVAREATHREPTAIRRWPWLAAGGFGLVHGVGFASALRELGLPSDSIASSLIAFNLGVELGQLAVVGVLVAVVAAGRRLIGDRIRGADVHRAACYLLGALAAWWLLQRVVELVCGAR